MGLNPGEIRIIDPDDIAEMFMMTTHNMPLNYLIDQLKEDMKVFLTKERVEYFEKFGKHSRWLEFRDLPAD